MKQYFEILGLPESASYEEVKNARIRLLKEFHPDLYAGNKKYAELRSSEVNIAFEALTKYFEKKKYFCDKSLDYKKETNLENKNEVKEKKLNINIKKEKKEVDKKCGKQLLDILIYILGLILVILFFVIIFSR